jgi:hypothetical protein
MATKIALTFSVLAKMIAEASEIRGDASSSPWIANAVAPAGSDA